ncbi:5'-nucleotidase C-terminal domain-containing protein [Clostridium sp.]|uniref:5'-nucleotidase C-terminal domain-containing protein n=1 Tax=Clostridium sp. TaxID=1506 RepID=UPI003F3ACAFE
MQKVQKRTKKFIATFVAMFMMLNIVLPEIQVFADILAKTASQIAAWNYTDAVSSATLPATAGELKAEAVLTNSQGNIPTFSTGSIATNGWDNGENSKFWHMRISTKGYENVTVSAKTRSSNTGPRDFKVIYSVDGGSEWKDVPESSYQIASTTLNYYMKENISLPEDASNCDSLLVRFIITSNTSVNGNTISSGGASNINNLVFKGTPIKDDSTVGGVVATPGNGSEISIGSKIQLSSETEGATIMHSINGSDFTEYNSEEMVTVTELPMTLVAYGTKAGLTDSVKTTFNYTQTKVQNVTASPNGGAVLLGTKVSLSTKTEGATIKYSVDNGQTWGDYQGAILLDTLPATVNAYAVSEGMIDSAISTFNFTQRENSEYSLYFGQLHSHTNNSDGLGSLDDAYNYAKNEADVDYLAVTDHSNSFDNDTSESMGNGETSTKWNNGQDAADKYTDNGFVGIYAYEMTWSNGTGHINTFNTPGFESRNKSEYKQPDALKTYYNQLKNFPSSFSQLNHPGQTFGDFNDFAHYDAEIDQLISLIEVGNGEGPVRGSGYFPSFEYYTRALDKGWHVSPTNNQDNHKGKWGNANTTRTAILADSLTRENVYDALTNRRTYATEDENLKIKYTLNGEVMGTILEEKPSEVNIKVDIEDPDNEGIGKVSVISNGGKVVASKVVTSSKETVEFNLPADYSYYYIRIDQADKDIAVTAPVWTGEVEKVGISKTEANTTMPIKGEEFSIKTDLYNNENSDLIVNSIEYLISGEEINKTSEKLTVKSLDTASYSFNYTPKKAGKYNVDVKVSASMNGVEKIFTDVLKIEVADPAVISRVVIDSTHFNDYVGGYYANNMGNFTEIANRENVSVHIEKNKITDEMLADTQLLVITAPAKKAGNANGVTYEPQSFSDEFIATVKKYVDNGGSIIVAGIASYQDGAGDFATSTQLNKLLEGIGATSRINKDQVVDDEIKVNNQNFRLAFNNFNMESPFLNGVVPEQVYSFYSGCSVNLNEEAVNSGKAKPLVSGHSSTYSNEPKTPGTPVVVPKGEVVALAVEELSGGGNMFIGGTVYISDFEVKASLDNANDLQYANSNIAINILESVKKELEVTPIRDVVNASEGEVFVVEGIATAGTLEGNAFFDSIYIQDQTAGINLFPVSGVIIKPGQKLRVVGSVSSYEGERQLNVSSFEVIDSSVNPIEPKVVTTEEATKAENVGTLMKVEGVVTKVNAKNGNVESIIVKDNSGVEARLFINGYIGYSDASSAKIEDIAKIGNVISGVGLGSVDPEGSRLRVRDRSEIKLVSEGVKNTEITILHTNDTHGRVEADSKVIGIDAISAIKKSIENSLLVDAGDTLHGLPFATMNRGADIVDLMKMAGYDLMVPGNHDFNYGYERLLELANLASTGEKSFEIISANVLKDNNTILNANSIKEINGVKVGFFGLSSPETAYKTNPNNIKGLEIKNPVETAKAQVKALKDAGVDVVVALAHIGDDESTEIKSTDIATEVEGIDIIVDGHSHSKYENGLKVGNTLIVSTGEYEGNLGKVTITLDSETKDILGTSATLINKEEASKVEADKEVSDKVSEIKKEQDKILSQVVGNTVSDLVGEREFVRAGETNLGNLITDAMLNTTGAEIAITNGGGIRASIKAGDITKGDIVAVLPFGNFIVTKYLTGSQIKDIIEHGVKDAPNVAGQFPHVAGMKYVYDVEKEAGNRVVKITINGKEIEMDKKYLVATNDFMSAGGDGYPHFGEAKTENEFSALNEALEEYINVLGTVDYKVEGRITVGKEEIKPEETNTAPVINAKNVVINKGDKFDPMSGVTAWDKEDGILTSKIEVLENTVDVNKAGEYLVTYSVIDSKGLKTTLTVRVTVKEASIEVPNPGEGNKPEEGGANNNKPENNLPQTGGEDSRVIFVIAVAIVIVGIVLIRKRKSVA